MHVQNPYRFTNIPAGSLFLDLYENPYFAVSLNKLKTSYTGSAIRVRRSSDNAEQDIGFSGDTFDTTALTAFVGANDGFVTTLYGQESIGRNFIQTAEANQPQIVTAGTVATRNGQPEIPLTSTRYLELLLPDTGGGLTNVWNGDDLTILSVHTYSGLGRLINSGGGSGFIFFGRAASTYQFRQNETVADLTPRPTNLTEYLVNMYFNQPASEVSHYFNNVIQDTDTLDGKWVVRSFRLGGNGNTFIKEFILYNDDQTANISAMNGTINGVYGIY